MKRVLFFAVMLLSLSAAAQKPIEMNLWPEGPKTNNGDPTDMAKVWVYLPDEKKATGRAIVCCPGGGYQHLAMDHEGHDWAPFFNGQGIALIVLKYRMPHGVWQVPAEDAEEAMRLVRHNAKKWHINTKDVGIMGFSAGGHLASTVATHASGDAAPNFQILFYPVISMDQGITHQGSRNNLLGKKPVNSLNYYEELYANKVPASLHIYPTGGHGFGIRQSFEYHFEMMLDLKAWLHSF